MVKDGEHYQGFQTTNLKNLGYIFQDVQTVTYSFSCMTVTTAVVQVCCSLLTLLPVDKTEILSILNRLPDKARQGSARLQSRINVLLKINRNIYVRNL